MDSNASLLNLIASGSACGEEDEIGVGTRRMQMRQERTWRRITKTAQHLKASPCAVVGTSEGSAQVAFQVGGDDEQDPYRIEQTFVDLDGIDEIPRVGSDIDLSEDYLAGLMMMAKRVHPETKLGYVQSLEAGDILMVAKASSVKKVLASSTHHFLGGLRPPSAAFFGHKVLFILEGQEWIDLRNVLKKSFQKQNVKNMSDDMAWAANEFNRVIGKFADSGEEFDMMRIISCYHIDAVGKVSFTDDLGALNMFEQGGEHPLENSFEYLLEELPRRAFAPDWETQNDFTSDNPDNRMMAQKSWQAREVIARVIKKRLDDIKNGKTPREDLLQKMIDAYGEQNPEMKDDLVGMTAELGDNLVEIVFAGYNTSVPTVNHALFLLAHYPEVAEEVKREVDEVLQGRIATSEDVKKLKILEKVYQETLRLCPPAVLLFRQLTRDVELDGMIIPRATRIWIPANAIHRDPDCWENPNVFNPHRFDKKLVRGSFIPFSDGPRSCAGRNFAMNEGILALATIFSRYEVSVAEDFDWKLAYSGFGARPFDQNTARVCMRMTVHHRQDLPK